VLAKAPDSIEEACAAYGRSLGTAFQLVDDLLDYEGATAELGKNVGDDLREGKPTLPLLLAMSHGSTSQRDLIRHAIRHGEVERLPDIIEIVRSTGALEGTRRAARDEARKAREQISCLPPSHFKDGLIQLCVQAVERKT
jgi:octaprenyl-diphosphate synthase